MYTAGFTHDGYPEDDDNHKTTKNNDTYKRNSGAAGLFHTTPLPLSSSPSFCAQVTPMLWHTFWCCNCLCLTGLTCVVGVLLIQIQMLSSQLLEQESHIDALQTQVQEKQQGQIAELTQQVQNEHSLTVMQMAGTFTLLTCLITTFHMSTHVRNYYEPAVQRRILAILWMTPIYAVTSCLSLVWPQANEYLSVLRDFYEAYVVYNFLSFLIAVLGRGQRDVAVSVLARHADHLRAPTTWLRRFYEAPPEVSAEAKASAVLTECQILALQFVFVRPATSIASFVCNNVGKDTADQRWWSYLTSPDFILTMIINISVFFAFSGLLKFYHAVQADLSWLQPFNKFMSIKGVVFVTFWQGLLISVLVNLKENEKNQNNYGYVNVGSNKLTDNSSSSSYYYNQTGTTSPSESYQYMLARDNYNDNNDEDPQAQAAYIQNILICLEMLFFSIAHWCVFPAEEWQEGYAPRRMAKPGLALGDFVSDMTNIVQQHRRRRRQRLQSTDSVESHNQCSVTSTSLEDYHPGDLPITEYPELHKHDPDSSSSSSSSGNDFPPPCDNEIVAGSSVGRTITTRSSSSASSSSMSSSILVRKRPSVPVDVVREEVDEEDRML